jgi:ribonuclease HI
MPCLPELYYSAKILFKNWLCLTEFDWCGLWVPGHCGIHGNAEADVFARAGSSSAFVRPEPCLPVVVYHTAPHRAWKLLVVSRECG